MKIKRNREANLFLVIVFCVGIVMACINPPFYECDGGLHYEWAMDVSYGNVLSPLANLSGHNKDVVTVPENYSDIKYRLVKPDTGEGGEYIRYLKTVKFSSETREKERDWIFTSLFYYPQALGLFLGRLFHVSVYWGVVLSRIMNLFAFLALVYTAIVITPVYKNIMAQICVCLSGALSFFNSRKEVWDKERLLEMLCHCMYTLSDLCCAWNEECDGYH